jgi:spore maturation protein CgeB
MDDSGAWPRPRPGPPSTASRDGGRDRPLRLLLLGKVASVTHWLEDCAAAWRAEGHEVRIAATRNPAIAPAIEAILLARALGAPLASRAAAIARAFSPDLIVAIGAYHVPPIILERLAALKGRPPMLGWVGDGFAPAAAGAAQWLDAVLYTDRGLLARHAALELPARGLYLPHAADPHAAVPDGGSRRRRMIFIANPTDHRRAIVAGLTEPIALHGPGWARQSGAAHEIHARRTPHAALHRLYAGHLAALNARNERNVVSGLNQRNFDPYVTATPVVAEHQADLAACFEPGREVLVYRDTDELNEMHRRLLAAPQDAAKIGRAGRARLLADHTYARRLRTMTQLG